MEFQIDYELIAVLKFKDAYFETEFRKDLKEELLERDEE
jgi:hypothetical protein